MSYHRFDLATELDTLRAGSRSASPHHVARTLVRAPGLRLVLLALDEGASLAEHRAEAPITLQVLDGRVQLACPGSTLELEAGTVVTLDRDVAHTLHAVTRSSVLLTIAWAGHLARAERAVAPAMQQLVA